MKIDWNVTALKIQCAEGELSLHRDNRGEPYQEGVTLQIEDGHDYRKSCAVFLENEALRADVATLGNGLRRLVLAIAHAARDPLYAESYAETSRLLETMGPKIDAARAAREG